MLIQLKTGWHRMHFRIIGQIQPRSIGPKPRTNCVQEAAQASQLDNLIILVSYDFLYSFILLFLFCRVLSSMNVQERKPMCCFTYVIPLNQCPFVLVLLDKVAPVPLSANLVTMLSTFRVWMVDDSGGPKKMERKFLCKSKLPSLDAQYAF